MTPAPTGISARVTIDEALNRARNTINLPATVIMMAAWGQALILVPSGKAPLPVLMVSIFVGLSAWPVAWLYRAVMTPRWKLWAYGGAGKADDHLAACQGAHLPGAALDDRGAHRHLAVAGDDGLAVLAHGDDSRAVPVRKWRRMFGHAA